MVKKLSLFEIMTLSFDFTNKKITYSSNKEPPYHIIDGLSEKKTQKKLVPKIIQRPSIGVY